MTVTAPEESPGASRVDIPPDPLPLDAGVYQAALVAGFGTLEMKQEGWQIHGCDDPSSSWIEVSKSQGVTPPAAQGWKLHVSATVDNACDVLGRALPLLVAEGAAFKVASTPYRLDALNRGDGGPSQIGKFLTVYPSGDPLAVRLAVALDGEMEGLKAPRVPSDRPLRPGSLVHYRFGCFGSRWMQTPIGEVVPALQRLDGGLEPDLRTTTYSAPAWTADPFEAAGVLEKASPVDLLVAERYLTAAVLGNSAGTIVRLCVDLDTGRKCVLKQARGLTGTVDSEAPVERVRHEAAILDRLGHEPSVPDKYDLFAEGADLILVQEYCEGASLDRHVVEAAMVGAPLAPDRVNDFCLQIAELVRRVHLEGLVYGDLKPSNLIVTAAGLRLVDWESAWPAGSTPRYAVIGTSGYASPQRLSGLPMDARDDVFSLGALFYYLATMSDPSHAPDRCALLDRPVRLLNPAAPTQLEALVARCLAAEPQDRPTIDEIYSALSRPPPAAIDEPDAADSFEVSPEFWLGQARTLAKRICAEALTSPAGGSVCWAGEVEGQPPGRDINQGAAGTVLALADAAASLDEPEILRTVRHGARWLAESDPFPGGPLPGLYVGEAGLGWALLKSGIALSDGGLVDRATDKSRSIAGMPFASPDLFNGTAGRLRFHLALWSVTGRKEEFDAALRCGEELLGRLESGDRAGCSWRIPEGYGAASGRDYLGYAHGIAGIGDALADLYEITGEARWENTLRRAAQRLGDTLMPVLDGTHGCSWPDVPDGTHVGSFWCHGAAGVARFLLRVWKTGLFPAAGDLATRAARATAAGSRWAGACQCHGLAGNAEVLVDFFQATKDSAYLRDAGSLALIALGYLSEPDGLSPRSFLELKSNDLMTGRAGLLACFTRLAAPDSSPHLLSLRAFFDGRVPDPVVPARTSG